MSSSDAGATSVDDAEPAAEPEVAVETDELREGLIESLTEALGDAVLESHIRPGTELWVRVAREAWPEAGQIARDKLQCRYFGFLAGLDWLPSPFGRYLDSEVDKLRAAANREDDGAPAAAAPEMVRGYAGGETRFQVFARVANISKNYGIILKADLDDDEPAVGTWIGNYAGANWHERETREMYGFHFEGHPYPLNLYLPGGFEGYPLRKDFPLLARYVKPWPGIVDVEELPEIPDEEGADSESTGDDAASESAGGDDA